MLGDNLVFNFDDYDDIPPLEQFLDKLISQTIRTSFYHHERKDEISILNIPLIIPNALLGTMTNTEKSKKSLMNMNKKYSSDVLGKLLKMVSEKRLDVLRLDSLNAEELKSVAKEIGISTAKKSLTFILEEVKAVTKIFLAGQGILLTIFLRISRPKDILES